MKHLLALITVSFITICLVTPTSAQATPTDGWTRLESVSLTQSVAAWTLRQADNASDSGYHDTALMNATLQLAFTGEAIRIGYRLHPQGAPFLVRVDGVEQGVIHTQANSAITQATDALTFPAGQHTLELVALIPSTGVGVVGIDYVEVRFTTPTPTPIPTLAPAPVAITDIRLVSLPATATPMPTLAPAQIYVAGVTVALSCHHG